MGNRRVRYGDIEDYRQGKIVLPEPSPPVGLICYINETIVGSFHVRAVMGEYGDIYAGFEPDNQRGPMVYIFDAGLQLLSRH